ncbi:hypothetical protein VTK73DRAFT_151 [Phialemonium thermophilum]|uniref:Uncharacterized protein n=1 Tax=Phialemonium thermophilum TaxID=223376 RepID=A0ABR3XGH0_9PEZI
MRSASGLVPRSYSEPATFPYIKGDTLRRVFSDSVRTDQGKFGGAMIASYTLEVRITVFGCCRSGCTVPVGDPFPRSPYIDGSQIPQWIGLEIVSDNSPAATGTPSPHLADSRRSHLGRASLVRPADQPFATLQDSQELEATRPAGLHSIQIPITRQNLLSFLAPI